MGYSREVYQIAEKALDERRRRAEQEAEERKKQFFLHCPRAGQIERELSNTAIQAARAILKGADTNLELTRLKEHNLALQQELSDLLRAAGKASDALEIHYQCALCHDEGYVDGKMCECMKQLLRQEAYRQLNSLSPLSLSTFDSFFLNYYNTVPIREGYPSPRKRMEDIFRFCRSYAADFSLSSPSLLMQGATGLGKTHLSLAIARVAINKGFGVIYGSTQNILTKLERERFSYRKDYSDESSEQHLLQCDLLILDDLGTEFATNFSNAAIYNIINSRIMTAKPTIISTNLSMKELERAYSERLVSRIMGNLIRLEFLGKDVRQQKRMQSNT